MSQGSGPTFLFFKQPQRVHTRYNWEIESQGVSRTHAVGSRVELLHFCSESRELSEDVTTYLLFHPGFTYKEGAVKRQTGLLITHIWSL